MPDRSLRHLLGVSGRRVARRARRLARRWSDGPPPERQWVRTVMLADLRAFFATLPVAELDTVECSSTTHADLGWRSHQVVRYPDLDLTDPPDDVPTYDVVICEQVLEHVTDPWASARTLRRLCRPGGYVVVSTPFLLKIHDAPGDYWRFTPDGLRLLLTGAGLDVVHLSSWGNRAAVRTNLFWWAAQRPWRPLRNAPSVPAVVWAVCRPAGEPV